MKLIESIKSKDVRKKFYFHVRHITGQAVLAAGSMGYIIDHLDVVQGWVLIAAAAGVVSLVLYFANKE